MRFAVALQQCRIAQRGLGGVGVGEHAYIRQPPGVGMIQHVTIGDATIRVHANAVGHKLHKIGLLILGPQTNSQRLRVERKPAKVKIGVEIGVCPKSDVTTPVVVVPGHRLTQMHMSQRSFEKYLPRIEIRRSRGTKPQVKVGVECRLAGLDVSYVLDTNSSIDDISLVVAPAIQRHYACSNSGITAKPGSWMIPGGRQLNRRRNQLAARVHAKARRLDHATVDVKEQAARNTLIGRVQSMIFLKIVPQRIAQSSG